MSTKLFSAPAAVMNDLRLRDMHLCALLALHFLKAARGVTVVEARLEDIAAVCGGLHLGRLCRALQELQAWGWLEVQSRRGCARGNRYTLREDSGAVMVLPSAVLGAGFTPAARRQLLLLYGYRNRESGLARPSCETLAERAGWRDTKRVSKTSALLQAKGCIERIRRGRSVQYRLAWVGDAFVEAGPSRARPALRVVGGHYPKSTTNGAGAHYPESTTNPLQATGGGHYPENITNEPGAENGLYPVSTTGQYPVSTTENGHQYPENTTCIELGLELGIELETEREGAGAPALVHEDLAAAELIYDNVRERYPAARQPNLLAWATQLQAEREYQERRDELPMEPGAFTDLLMWALAHRDWARFIRSPQSFIRNVEALLQSRYEENQRRHRRAG